MRMRKEDNENVVAMFFFKPWLFWGSLLSISPVGGFVGFSVIILVIALLFTFLEKRKAILFTLLFLLWVGPIILFSPLLLPFIIGNTLSGDWNVPVGCGRNKETGELSCM